MSNIFIRKTSSEAFNIFDTTHLLSRGLLRGYV